VGAVGAEIQLQAYMNIPIPPLGISLTGDLPIPLDPSFDLLISDRTDFSSYLLDACATAQDTLTVTPLDISAGQIVDLICLYFALPPGTCTPLTWLLDAGASLHVDLGISTTLCADSITTSAGEVFTSENQCWPVSVPSAGYHETATYNDSLDLSAYAVFRPTLFIDVLTYFRFEIPTIELTWDDIIPGDITTNLPFQPSSLDFVDTDCDCTPESAGACGAGSCSDHQRRFTRSCTPSGCAWHEDCRYDPTCNPDDDPSPDPDPEWGECTETGYGQCNYYTFGDCTVSFAADYYDRNNVIRWGQIVDSSDAYVIGHYEFAWEDREVQTMYYGINGDACEYGGCNGQQIDLSGSRNTVFAPGIAYADFILAYNETPNYACWIWYNAFNPSYGNGTEPIYVLKCYDDGDCGAQRCDKSGPWSTWECVNRFADGHPCNDGNECSSGFCDNDGVGGGDDGWCFSPSGTYFDGQEPTQCEYSTGSGHMLCDEHSVGAQVDLCIGLPYREETCNDACAPVDIGTVFECTDSGCNCEEPMCDQRSAGSPIPTCSSSQPYIADRCTQTAGAADRFESICRSSEFAAGCTGDRECNGVPAGTGNCSLSCENTCGNGTCDTAFGENCVTCLMDCGMPVSCGNQSCEEACGETPQNCPTDCADCGNATCDGPIEDCLSCPEDCPPLCGDGLCCAGETCITCPLDCTGGCGDGCCDHSESCQTCPDDCEPVCGDGLCCGESVSCPEDCSPCVLYDMNGDGSLTEAGDIPFFVNCVYFGVCNCPCDTSCVVPGDCNKDGRLSVIGDVPCFVSCFFSGQCAP